MDAFVRDNIDWPCKYNINKLKIRPFAQSTYRYLGMAAVLVSR